MMCAGLLALGAAAGLAQSPPPSTAAQPAPAKKKGGFFSSLGDSASNAVHAQFGEKNILGYYQDRPGGLYGTRIYCLIDVKSGDVVEAAMQGQVSRYPDGRFGLQKTGNTFQDCNKMVAKGMLVPTGYFAADGLKAIDRLHLRNILPQWDEDQPITKQYPHVAVEIVKAPPDWAVEVPRPLPYYLGCWTLHLTVWDSAIKKRDIPQFQYCLPQDGSDEVAFGANATWPTRAEKDIPFLTGVRRTTGPQPPSHLVPDDRATADAAIQHGAPDFVSTVAARYYWQTGLGMMLGTLRWQLGARDADAESHDTRVWIVSVTP